MKSISEVLRRVGVVAAARRGLGALLPASPPLAQRKARSRSG